MAEKHISESDDQDQKTYKTFKTYKQIKRFKHDYEHNIITHVIGPVSLTEMKSNKYNKHIYLFGDMHVKKAKMNITNNAITIDKFIDKTITNNHESVIHVFVESYFYHRNNANCVQDYVDCYLSDTDIFFRESLSFYKKNTPYNRKNKYIKRDIAQFHYVDVRDRLLKSDSVILKFEFDDIINMFSNEVVYNKLYNSFETNIKKLNIIRKEYNICNFLLLLKNNYVFGCSNIETFINILQVIDKSLSKLIIKQLNKIRDNDIKNSICTFFLKKIIEQLELMIICLKPELYDQAQMICSKQDSDTIMITINEIINTCLVIKSILSLEQPMLKINVFLMDCYLICRLFKTDSEANTKDKVMIYTGTAHTKNYIEFLTELGFETVKSVENSNEESADFQTIDITQFDPFFK